MCIRDRVSTQSTWDSNIKMSVEEHKISSEEWKSRLESVKLSKTDLNRLVFNYLCLEGYSDTVKSFEKESGEKALPQEIYAIEERKEIRSLILKDSIKEAISLINNLCPEILDRNPALSFKLQKRRMLSLIRLNKTEEALDFARSKLAPLAKLDRAFLAELEKLMRCLAFGVPQDEQQAENSAKYTLALEVNEAIMRTFCSEREEKLTLLLKFMLYSQKKEEQVPQIGNLVLGKFNTECCLSVSYRC
eukprot:TRINITY_DN5565_c0_g1_i2.p1 TRINITY_DN5565_c0_g1~~TRINITY_DN5565_c0_g1_i2.p1  ORF type:complete len:247 (+),score=66.13 TRINITY_DN5565_c0_g1_i2:70-810(+)